MEYFCIEINLSPEIFNGKERYFWCILKHDNQPIASNCGHGWAKSIIAASKAASDYYTSYLKND